MKDNKIQEKENSQLQTKILNLKEIGITLIALVVTIVILLILVGVTLTFALGENGIIGVAKKARKEQIIGETKEAIGLEITEAYTEATLRREELEKKQVEDIVNKYGKLQEDGDTIITKKDGYEISLKEIYSGVLSESGSYSAKLDQIEMLEKELEDLKSKPIMPTSFTTVIGQGAASGDDSNSVSGSYTVSKAGIILWMWQAGNGGENVSITLNGKSANQVGASSGGHVGFEIVEPGDVFKMSVTGYKSGTSHSRAGIAAAFGAFDSI